MMTAGSGGIRASTPSQRRPSNPRHVIGAACSARSATREQLPSSCVTTIQPGVRPSTAASRSVKDLPSCAD
jgi:hypothetical protein